MPIDETIVEEDIVENTEIIEDYTSNNSFDSPNTEIIDGDSLVQGEEELTGTDSLVGEEVPETSPEENIEIIPEEDEEEILETDTGDFYFDGEEISTYALDEVEVYTDLEAFTSSAVQVDLYQYTVLERLEFMQYALCIVIALLFLQIFVRYKK